MRIRAELIAKDPVFYKGLSEKKILKILNYFTRNLVKAISRHRHVSIYKFCNFYPDNNRLFEYRQSTKLKIPIEALRNHLRTLRKEWKIRWDAYELRLANSNASRTKKRSQRSWGTK